MYLVIVNALFSLACLSAGFIFYTVRYLTSKLTPPILPSRVRAPDFSRLNRQKTAFIFAAFFLFLVPYVIFTEYRLNTIINRYGGGYGKFFCSEWRTINKELEDKVVRIVGGYSEGSGFFISGTEVLTNFHVIADEPSPKIIFPDGSFVTADGIKGHKDADLAILTVKKPGRPDLVLKTKSSQEELQPNEPVLAAGYPLGTMMPGKVTVIQGYFSSFRKSRQDVVDYIMTNMSLVEGMSGGPLVDQCGEVVGVNTMGLSGLSLYISYDSVRSLADQLTDQDVQKINVDPAKSPAEAVWGFYTYLKARRMEEGFKLLSREYLKKTNFQEWTGRFVDILDVQVYITEPYGESDNAVFVKFATKNWVNGETEIHYFEGVWRTVPEDGVYKMRSSNIREVGEPEWDWFDEGDSGSIDW